MKIYRIYSIIILNSLQISYKIISQLTNKNIRQHKKIKDNHKVKIPKEIIILIINNNKIKMNYS